jgi:predicted amidophosphoribosyltransferase
MNHYYACRVCRRSIRSAAIHHVTEHAQISCSNCVADSASHGVLYPACEVAGHTVLDHPVITGTALGAHRHLMRIWRAQEVAAG